jgi:protein involved in polysaccharide export with SLBB domain
MSIRKVGKRLGSCIVACGLLLGGIGLSGCGSASQEQQFAALPPGLVAAPNANPVAQTAAPEAAAPTDSLHVPGTNLVSTSAPAPVASTPTATNASGFVPEAFRPGDSLTVTFTDTPITIQPFDQKIKSDGTITLILNKMFHAAGKTTGQLEQEIRAAYVPSYYKYMTVTVTRDISTQWYYVEGEVRQPNREIYNSRLTVTMAIASAGGFTDFANKKKVKLIRVDGRTQTVNCVKALNDPSLDPEVYPGDKVHVPRRLW